MEAEYTANVIAENMYSQCNPDGQQFLLLSCIVDHKKDESALDKSNQTFNVNGKDHLKKTTKG